MSDQNLPPPHNHDDATAAEMADAILADAFAAFGVTRRGLTAAWAAVVTSSAFEEGDTPPCH